MGVLQVAGAVHENHRRAATLALGADHLRRVEPGPNGRPIAGLVGDDARRDPLPRQPLRRRARRHRRDRCGIEGRGGLERHAGRLRRAGQEDLGRARRGRRQQRPRRAVRRDLQGVGAGRGRQPGPRPAIDRQRVDVAVAGIGFRRNDQEARPVRRQLRVGDLPGAARQLPRRRIRRRQIGDVEVHPAVALRQEPQPRRPRHEAHRRRRRARLIEGADPGRVLQVFDDASAAWSRPERGDVAVLVVGGDDDRGGVTPVARHDRQAPQQRTGPRINLGAAERHRALALRGQVDRDQAAPLLRVADVAAPGQQFRIARRGNVGRDVGAVRRCRLVHDQGVGDLAVVGEHEVVDRLALADGDARHGLRILAGIGARFPRLGFADDGEELRFLGLEELLAVGRRRPRLGRAGVGQLLEGGASRAGAGRGGAGRIGAALNPHPVEPLIADERDGAAAVRPARMRLRRGGAGDKRPRPDHRIHDDDIAIDDADGSAMGRVPLAVGGRGQAALVIGQSARLARLRSGGRCGRRGQAGAGDFPGGGLVLAARAPLEIEALGIAGPAQGRRRVADQPGAAHDAVDGELEGVGGGPGRGGKRRGKGPSRRQDHEGDGTGTRRQASQPRREKAHGAYYTIRPRPASANWRSRPAGPETC